MNQQENNLFLNIVPVEINADKIIIGRLLNRSKEEYDKLRDSHWRTHAFRFDNRTNQILNVSLQSDILPLGESDEVDTNEHLLLIARAIQHKILVWFAGALPILRYNNKKLTFWGKEAKAHLLSRTLDEMRLEKKVDGLEVTLRYEIDCRMFNYGEDGKFLGLVIDLATSNIIDIPVAELQRRGLVITGRYVCRRQAPEREYLSPKLEFLGKVSAVQGGDLLLTESDGTTRIQADKVFLEPRLENFSDVIKLYYGLDANKVLSKLASYRKPISSAIGKLEQIKQTLQGLKFKGTPQRNQAREITIANNVQVILGDLLDSSDTRFPIFIETKRPGLLFGPQGRNPGLYPDKGITDFGPYMYMQHERNSPLVAVICESRFRGQVEQFMRLLIDGFPDEQWTNDRRPNPFPQGLLGKYRLNKLRVEYEECKNETPEAYREAVNRLLARLPETPALAIAQIQESFAHLFGNFNPYFVSNSQFGN